MFARVRTAGTAYRRDGKRPISGEDAKGVGLAKSCCEANKSHDCVCESHRRDWHLMYIGYPNALEAVVCGELLALGGHFVSLYTCVCDFLSLYA